MSDVVRVRGRNVGVAMSKPDAAMAIKPLF